MERVLRWEVPVDDEWHDIGAGRVVHVAARSYRKRPGDLVEVWTLEVDYAGDGSTADLAMRPVTVIGTGHPAPSPAWYIGTAIVPAFVVHETGQSRHPLDVESAAGLVWHVFGRKP